MSKPIYETMTQHPIGMFIVRTWCKTPRPEMGPREDVVRALEGIPCGLFEGPRPDQIHDALLELDKQCPEDYKIAAFEILSPYKHGLVCYLEWP